MVIGLVECPRCHTRVIPMSPDNRCPACQELISATGIDVTTTHSPDKARGQPEPTHLPTSTDQQVLERDLTPRTMPVCNRPAVEFGSRFRIGMGHFEGEEQALLARAIKLEAKGRFEDSLRLYQRILSDFPGTDAVKDADIRFNNLRKDIEPDPSAREMPVEAPKSVRTFGNYLFLTGCAGIFATLITLVGDKALAQFTTTDIVPIVFLLLGSFLNLWLGQGLQSAKRVAVYALCWVAVAGSAIFLLWVFITDPASLFPAVIIVLVGLGLIYVPPILSAFAHWDRFR